MRTTFTPGPWEVDSGMVQTGREILSTGLHIPICHMDREYNNGTLPVERDANARLIAAAPDLLEALRDLNDALVKAHNGAHDLYDKNPTKFLDELVGICGDAIAKAEGQS